MKNFKAAGRRESLKRFGLLDGKQDTTFIAAPGDAVTFDLSPQIDGSVQSFTLPYAVDMIEHLLWNGSAVYQGPGGDLYFNLAADKTTATVNFTPQLGDTLVARCWPL